MGVLGGGPARAGTGAATGAGGRGGGVGGVGGGGAGSRRRRRGLGGGRGRGVDLGEAAGREGKVREEEAVVLGSVPMLVLRAAWRLLLDLIGIVLPEGGGTHEGEVVCARCAVSLSGVASSRGRVFGRLLRRLDVVGCEGRVEHGVDVVVVVVWLCMAVGARLVLVRAAMWREGVSSVVERGQVV